MILLTNPFMNIHVEFVNTYCSPILKVLIGLPESKEKYLHCFFEKNKNGTSKMYTL